MITTPPPEILAVAERLRNGMARRPDTALADALDHWFHPKQQAWDLLAWLREFMRERHEGYVRARLRAGAPPDGLGLRSTRDPVSRDVAVALGFTTNPFEVQHGTIVWQLCELAGWQDGHQEQENA